MKRFYLLSIFVLLVAVTALSFFGPRATAAQEPTAAATSSDPTLAANKALMLRLYNVFNTENIDELKDFVADDFVEHTPGAPAGRYGLESLIVGDHNSFRDFKYTSEDLIAEGDKVVLRGTWTGTQTGLMGYFPVTGKKVTLPQIDIIHVVNGKIVEHWEITDNLEMLTQLGLFTFPGPTPAPTVAATQASK